VVGLTRKKTLTLIEAPQDESFLLPGDILASPKAFYLVHTIRKSNSKYRYQYSISCTRLSADDEAIAQGRHYKIFPASKAYLQMALTVKLSATESTK
jgi:hypothetical protein